MESESEVFSGHQMESESNSDIILLSTNGKDFNFTFSWKSWEHPQVHTKHCRHLCSWWFSHILNFLESCNFHWKFSHFPPSILPMITCNWYLLQRPTQLEGRCWLCGPSPSKLSLKLNSLRVCSIWLFCYFFLLLSHLCANKLQKCSYSKNWKFQFHSLSLSLSLAAHS